MCPSCVCRVLCRERPLRRDDHSCRAVLPAVSVYVQFYEIKKCQKIGGLDCVGLLCYRNKRKKEEEHLVRRHSSTLRIAQCIAKLQLNVCYMLTEQWNNLLHKLFSQQQITVPGYILKSQPEK